MAPWIITHVKRAEFISKSTEIRETFAFASPVETLRAVKVFAGDFYGSNLWHLPGEKAEQVYHTWNTCIKLAWHVPRGTHTYFVDWLLSSELSHVKTDIVAKYIPFFKSLRFSPSPEVSIASHIVARDVQTNTGSNLHYIKHLTGLDPWQCSSDKVKQVLGAKLTPVQDKDRWRLPYLGKLLEQRGEVFYQCGDCTELTELINSICVI